jgi:hypothetical protein
MTRSLKDIEDFQDQRRGFLYGSNIEFLLNHIKTQELEIARLKAGQFSEEEFQNLCHTFSDGDKQRFFDGCAEYQRKLFGQAERDRSQQFWIINLFGELQLITARPAGISDFWFVIELDHAVRGSGFLFATKEEAQAARIKQLEDELVRGVRELTSLVEGV